MSVCVQLNALCFSRILCGDLNFGLYKGKFFVIDLGNRYHVDIHTCINIFRA